MVVFEGKAGIGPLRPSGDSGFVCCLIGYPTAANPNGYQWTPQSHLGAPVTVFAGSLVWTNHRLPKRPRVPHGASGCPRPRHAVAPCGCLPNPSGFPFGPFSPMIGHVHQIAREHLRRHDPNVRRACQGRPQGGRQVGRVRRGIAACSATRDLRSLRRP
jgi:hypothetical protein